MTRVVQIYQHGGPEELRFEDFDIGEPGAGEVRLKIEAIGLNRSEAAFRAGQYPVAPKFPTLIGYEGVGVIEALGAGAVKDLSISSLTNRSERSS
jgi:NADPH:quinone reductase-like Zn-dependent oxidoreductase